MKVSWWKDIPNFGDALTPLLLKKLFNIDSVWSEPWEADLIGCGSYLEIINKNKTFTGYIWGTGRMFEGEKIDLSKAKVLALRGKLTQNSVISDCKVLGDPGLLCRYIKPTFKVKETYELGIIPHWNDHELAKKYPGAKIINVRGDIESIIAEADSCQGIISSSLHGIVLADALGKPRLWEYTSMNPGDGFKFRDYQSIFGDNINIGVWYVADSIKVSKICNDLLKAFKKIYE